MYVAAISDKADRLFYSPCGTRIWYPVVDEKPLIETVYNTIEEAFLCYQKYAKKAGFVAKKSSSWRPSKCVNPKNKLFRCNKEGSKYVKKVKPDPSAQAVGTSEQCVMKKKSRPRKTSTFRVGCDARFSLSKVENGKYKLVKFVEGHNHQLLEKDEMKFAKRTSSLGYMKEQLLFQVSTLSIGPVKGFRLLKELYGGFEEMEITKVDCKNFKRDVNVYVGMEDDKWLLRNFLEECNL